MIARFPERYRAPLPAGHWWAIFEDSRGALVVVVSDRVPAGSRLERQLAREAVRAWRETGRAALPVAVAAGAWGRVRRKVHQARQSDFPFLVAAAAVVVLVVVLAAGLVRDNGGQPIKDVNGRSTPPTAGAPPVIPSPVQPSPKPHRTAKPSPSQPRLPVVVVTSPAASPSRPGGHKHPHPQHPSHPSHPSHPHSPGTGGHHPSKPHRPTPPWRHRPSGNSLLSLRLPLLTLGVDGADRRPGCRLIQVRSRAGHLLRIRVCL